MAVWSPLLQAGSEGPTFIFCTACACCAFLTQADRFVSGFPIDYGPVLLRRPFGFPSRWTPCPPETCRRWLQVHLGCIRLSLSCPFRLFHTFLLLRPARHYPRFWIWRPSFGRQRDFNPPEQRAAQHALRASPPPHTARPGSHELPVDHRGDHRWGLPCCVWSPVF